MPLYDYLTPKLDFKRKFNHRQSFLYKGRLTVRTIRKFRIGSSLRIESRIRSNRISKLRRSLIFPGLDSFIAQQRLNTQTNRQLLTLYIQHNSIIQCKTFIKETVRLITYQEYCAHLFTHTGSSFSDPAVEPQVNSRTFQYQIHFPGLSRFGNFRNKNSGLPGLSRRRGNPDDRSENLA